MLKLVAVRSARPAGSIPKILTAALEPAAGQRVEMAEVYRRYSLDCAADGNNAVSPEQFVDPLKRFCKGAGIRTKVQGDHVYLLNVRIAAAHAEQRHATRSGCLASISDEDDAPCVPKQDYARHASRFSLPASSCRPR